MKPINNDVAIIKSLLCPIVGNIKTRSHFSYYGISKNTITFALFKQGNFYLNIPESLKDRFLPYEGVVLLQDKKMGVYSKHFYLIPHSLIQKRALFSYWVNTCLNELEVIDSQHRANRSKKLIRKLPNLTFKIERTLYRLGIHTVDDLIEKGEINTFIELIKNGVDVEKTMLFRLYGAIHHQLIYTLTQKQKARLILELNNALYKEGIRQRF